MRDILVHATRHDCWTGSVQYAAQLAAHLKASLTGMYCVERPSLHRENELRVAQPALEPDPDQTEAALAAKGAFCAYAGSMGVIHSAWVVHEGDPIRGLAHLGHWHDLLVVGRGVDSPWKSDDALADILVMTSRLPCLVVAGVPDLTPLRPMRIAVAWDGSLPAIRALHAAIQLLEKAREVILLIGARADPQPLPPDLPEFDLDGYCERHGLKVQRILLPPEQDATGAVLRASAVQSQAELLVMGAFGHVRVHERQFGGVTPHLLRDCPIPVLLRH